ncbi:transmembrane protein, putative [Medicago truncatula]|uniref:Transmembrane protein, putative n=1 Tax=Medicago truncatula TaxID=3880 RepID=G7IY49_MEDTR|nr:transmembrane protein, putative [Medicago truncatula]
MNPFPTAPYDSFYLFSTVTIVHCLITHLILIEAMNDGDPHVQPRLFQPPFDQSTRSNKQTWLILSKSWVLCKL